MSDRLSELRITLLLAFAAGWLLACGGEPQPSKGPTYHADVAPMLAEHCIACHRDGGIAPFSLMTFEDAHGAASLIAAVTAERRMPPWHVDDSGNCGSYRDDPSLSADEIGIFGAWAGNGAPEGDRVKVAPLPPPTKELEEVSVTLDPGGSYTPEPDLQDDYRCFIVDPHL